MACRNLHVRASWAEARRSLTSSGKRCTHVSYYCCAGGWQETGHELCCYLCHGGYHHRGVVTDYVAHDLASNSISAAVNAPAHV